MTPSSTGPLMHPVVRSREADRGKGRGRTNIASSKSPRGELGRTSPSSSPAPVPPGSEVSDTTAQDSGVNLASPGSTASGQKKAKVTDQSVPAPGSTVSHTPPLSPDTRRRLDEETQGVDEPVPDDDGPLSGDSDHTASDGDGDSDQEMASAEGSPDDDDKDENDIEPLNSEVLSTMKDTVTPSTSNNPTPAVAPTSAARSDGNLWPGHSFRQPGQPWACNNPGLCSRVQGVGVSSPSSRNGANGAGGGL